MFLLQLDDNDEVLLIGRQYRFIRATDRMMPAKAKMTAIICGVLILRSSFRVRVIDLQLLSVRVVESSKLSCEMVML